MQDEKHTPIDSEEKVEQSNDMKIDQDFPGYPHYPAKEDILNPQNHTERVNANVENLSHDNLRNEPSDKKKAMTAPDPDEIEGKEDLGIVMGTEADVTADDLKALGDPNKDFDMDEDEEIFSDGSGGAFEATEGTVSELDSRDLRDELERTGEDLDISGGELDDVNEDIGEEDEENNYYSLGGDRNDKTEDDPASSY